MARDALCVGMGGDFLVSGTSGGQRLHCDFFRCTEALDDSNFGGGPPFLLSMWCFERFECNVSLVRPRPHCNLEGERDRGVVRQGGWQPLLHVQGRTPNGRVELGWRRGVRRAAVRRIQRIRPSTSTTRDHVLSPDAAATYSERHRFSTWGMITGDVASS